MSLLIKIQFISVYSAGVPYAARFTAAVRITLPLGEFNQDFGMSVCLSSPKMLRRNYVRACSKSVLGGKN